MSQDHLVLYIQILGVWSRRGVVCSPHRRGAAAVAALSAGIVTRSSGGRNSDGISRRGRRVAAVAATSAGVVVLSGSCSNGISRRNCYSRIYSIQSQGKSWLLLRARGVRVRVRG